MPSSSDMKPAAPYLTLSIPQAFALPAPQLPEQVSYPDLLTLIDHRAQHQGDRIAAGFAELVDTVEDRWECTTVSYADVKDLGTRTANLLRADLDAAVNSVKPCDPGLPPLRPAPVVAILCPSGFEFFVHALGVWFSEFALLPIALGTTPEGCANLCRKTGAFAILAHPTLRDVAAAAIDSMQEQGGPLPTIIATLDRQAIFEMKSSPSPSLPSSADRPQRVASDDTLIIFHSSGSSGLPKPIYHVHHFWSRSLATAAGTDVPAYTTTPLYHGGMSDFFRSLQAGSTIFFHPISGPGNTLSTSSICQAFSACKAAANLSRQPGYFLSVPFILEALSQSGEGIAFLRDMLLVSTGGAPLPQNVGDKLVANDVPIVSRLGSSECGFLSSSFRDFANDTDWNWLRFETKVDGTSVLQFRENSDNPGLYELVVTADWPTKLLSTSSDGSFATEDLYVRHPHHQDRYQYATRVDDTLVLLNGKKFAAGLIEGKLRRSDLVADAIVFGANRALVGAIIIPKEEVEDDASKYAFVQRLRPLLEHEINPSLPTYAQIRPELIVVSDRQFTQSVPRSSKGTLQRGQAYQKFSGMFDKLYSDYETGNLPGYPPRRDVSGNELKAILLALANEALPNTISDYSDDFYRAGMDSIGAMRLKAMVNQNVFLGVDRRLRGNMIYDYPTVEALAQLVDSLRGNNDVQAPMSSPSLAETHAQMHDLVSRSAKSLPALQRRPSGLTGSPLVVLTGVTGALGARLLFSLLVAAPDTKVVCLVRASSNSEASERARTSIRQRGLASRIRDSDWSDRIHCFASDIGDATRLGVSSPDFLELVNNANSVQVIHAAWSVNFALSLQSFAKDNIASLVNLLSFSLGVGAEAFLFCSSIASVLGGNAAAGQRVPEVASLDPASAGALGYSQSKWVAEGLVGKAAQHGLKAAVARIGQLCTDRETGVWNESEGWPLMVRTAKELNVLPVLSDAQKIDWLTVDVAADTLQQLLTATAARPVSSQGGQNGEASFYHVCLPCDALAPQDVPVWSHFLDWLAQASLTFRREPLPVWLAEVESNSSHVRGRALLDIWRKLPEQRGDEESEPPVLIETSAARQASTALKQSRPVDSKLIDATISHWKTTGFL
ncbi:unnamed protein product [Parajaminaea phylloscopi]